MKMLSGFLCVMLVFFGIVGLANATLYDRGGGLIYDDVLDITWLQDANYAAEELTDARRDEIIAAVGTIDGHTLVADDFQKGVEYYTGRMTWWGAMAWADQLVYGGFDDWRLPDTPNLDGGWPGTGYNVTGSEMGHMFYINLEGDAYGPRPSPSFTDGNGASVSFENLEPNIYWSDTEHAYNPAIAWSFHFYNGSQYCGNKSNIYFAWAVRDGDVSAPIPEPATMLISKVKVKFKDEPITDEFEIKGEFTLGEGSDGIDLFNESIEASVDSFNVVIPANTLIEEKPGEYKFKGIIDGIEVDLKIKEIDTDTFEFKVKAKGFDLTGTTNLVNVKLLVGDDTGTADVRLTGELKFHIKHQK